MIHLDFIVAGAQKAGTTSLHEWLMQQPDVKMPTIKETHFFSHDDRFKLGIEWYEKQFSRKGKVIGEVDPEYMFFENAAERIAQMTNVGKIICILRFPFDRAFSHYQMSVRRNYEPLSFHDALKAEKKRLSEGGLFSIDHHSYMARGMYSGQIERFKRCLPNAEFMFVRFENLIDPEERSLIFASICNFTGVASSPKKVDTTKESNKASMPRSSFLRDQLYKDGKLKKMVGKLVPSHDWRLRLGLWLDRLNQGPLKEKSFYTWQDIPYEWVDRMKRDIHLTEKVTGLDLSEWAQRIAQMEKASAKQA